MSLTFGWNGGGWVGGWVGGRGGKGGRRGERLRFRVTLDNVCVFGIKKNGGPRALLFFVCWRNGPPRTRVNPYKKKLDFEKKDDGPPIL